MQRHAELFRIVQEVLSRARMSMFQPCSHPPLDFGCVFSKEHQQLSPHHIVAIALWQQPQAESKKTVDARVARLDSDVLRQTSPHILYSFNTIILASL